MLVGSLLSILAKSLRKMLVLVVNSLYNYGVSDPGGNYSRTVYRNASHFTFQR